MSNVSDKYDKRMQEQYGEWSMGNGQCPICFGVGPSFYPGVCYLTPVNIGHELDCPAPNKTIMKGSYGPPPLTPGEEASLENAKVITRQLYDSLEQVLIKLLCP